MMLAPIGILVLGWFLGSTIGTCAYFANETEDSTATGNRSLS